MTEEYEYHQPEVILVRVEGDNRSYSPMPGTEVCDFCNSRPVVWRYHVLPIPLAGEYGGRVFRTRDDWAACPTCKGMVDADQREALLQRSLGSLIYAMRADGTPVRPAMLEASIRPLHEQFFGVKDGPGEAHPPRQDKEAP